MENNTTKWDSNGCPIDCPDIDDYPNCYCMQITKDIKNTEIKFKPCPKCGREVDILGGPESWIPTFYDPDSGDGGPHYIHCECGLRFSIGYCELEDFAKAWNEFQPKDKVERN